MAMNSWVITYDVSRDNLRMRVATALGGHGPRVLYSTFEFHSAQRYAYALFDRVAAMLDPGDRLLLFPTCSECGRRHVGTPIERPASIAWVVGG